MATRQQRSRKHARRVHHQLTQRARLRSALDASLPGTMKEIESRMQERGYERDPKNGHWRRGPREAWREEAARGTPRHLTWQGILAKRKLKRRR